MFPVVDYTTLLTGVQHWLVYLLAGILVLVLSKVFLTAALSASCGEAGASMISSLVVFGAVMLFAAYVLTHHGGFVVGGISVADPFQVVNGVLSDLTSTLSEL